MVREWNLEIQISRAGKRQEILSLELDNLKMIIAVAY
jgi:hypothetical protein